MKIYRFTILIVFMIIPFLGFNQESERNNNELIVSEWLYSGVVPVKMPVANDEKDINGKPFDKKALLKFEYTDVSKLRPEAGKKTLFSGVKWKSLKVGKDGDLILKQNDDSGSYLIQYFVTYIEAHRWTKAKLIVESSDLLEIFLDGDLIGGIYKVDDGSSTFEKEIKLEKKNYTLVIKTLTKADEDLKMSAKVKLNELFVPEDLTIWTNPQHYVDIAHVLEGPIVNSVEVSADGKYYMIKYSETTPPEGKSLSWVEIFDLPSKKLIRTIQDCDYTGIQWLPTGHKYSFISEEKLWLNDAASGTVELITDKFNGENYQWAPNAEYVIYSVSENPPPKSELAQKIENMQDFRPWWRTRSFLYKLDVRSGLKQRLTFGNLSTELRDISPDAEKIIYSETNIDNQNRPFSVHTVYELNLETFLLDTLWTNNFTFDVYYSPDGNKLLVTAGPNFFGDLGMNLQGYDIPSDYDTQAYIYDLTNGDVKPISKNFDPSINQADWAANGSIYFVTTDKSYVNIYKYDLKTDAYTLVKTGKEAVRSFDYVENSGVAGFVANGISEKTQGFILDLNTLKVDMVCDPQKEFFKDIKFGKDEDWIYTKEDGNKIDGFIYYPPDFNPDKKYPAIVYYYAGASPIDRSYGGRYPKELYAAHGYVVYVVNPSGCVGYGQDFSAAHVNNWGKTVAGEIIDAAKYFIANHSFIDQDKVGCMGASYGGFMTMLLMAQTDIFATAISHAGISSISSYWGEGCWGFWYNATSAANSFPWNNKDLYVGQSALFNADKYTNSILLLHGGADTNVPVGESVQLYTALKLLGKEVEFVEIPGQNHWILDYKKRIAWQKTIAAWFDRELKDEPEWWDDLYPDPNLK